MKVLERRKPRKGPLRRLWWEYRTRSGTPGYIFVPTSGAVLLIFNTVIYTVSQAHWAVVAICFLTVMFYGVMSTNWWIGNSYHLRRALVKACCRREGCEWEAFTIWSGLAERATRQHVAEVHQEEITSQDIAWVGVDDMDLEEKEKEEGE